ncbi:hypothetical protein F5Y14DRAFT_442982 [Nemania sp. NC0429]|nr:hypothetical protein F5Y14DRAFT_442982 [Nemania sp. NC0429]
MKSLLTLVAYPIAVLTASIPRETQAEPCGPFYAGAWRIDQPFFVGNSINASGGKFYLNRDTSTYCPAGVQGLNCSLFAGTATTLVIGDGSTTMSLEVTVPGGQQVYIAPDGSLSYTQAHSAYIPTGSTVNGFSRFTSTAFAAPTLLYSAGRSWYLCPVTEGPPRERAYQVFATSETIEGCLDMVIRTADAPAGQVWQYA